jgi:hypothetical protein
MKDSNDATVGERLVERISLTQTLLDDNERLRAEIARLRLLVPPIAGTVNAETGMDFIPWSVAASAGQAADISRRTAVLPQWFEMVRLSQWVPVGERLPQEGVDVLVMTHYGMHVADLDEYGTWNASHGDSWQFPLPTHWMPLPEPPEVT